MKSVAVLGKAREPLRKTCNGTFSRQKSREAVYQRFEKNGVRIWQKDMT
ncbi:MAG: hypothetical protein HFG61_01270 [Lachnospiraceae bacterium]|nr:hypothetical protein [Lachnospiraceae bacterium]